MHESEQKFSICKCRTIKLNESYRLVTIVLVLNTHSRQIHSIILTTIAAAARSRYSSFWARRGSVAVGFLFLSPWCGSGALAFFFYRRGALAFFFYRRGAVAVTFQPRWTSLIYIKSSGATRIFRPMDKNFSIWTRKRNNLYQSNLHLFRMLGMLHFVVWIVVKLYCIIFDVFIEQSSLIH